MEGYYRDAAAQHTHKTSSGTLAEMKSMQPAPPKRDYQGMCFVMDTVVFPNTAPIPRCFEEWRKHFTQSEREHNNRNHHEFRGLRLAFAHDTTPLAGMPVKSLGEVVDTWVSEDKNLCFRCGVYGTPRGRKFAAAVKNGDIRYMSLGHVNRVRQPGDPDLTDGLAENMIKTIFEVSGIEAHVGPGREGCDIDPSSFVGARTRSYTSDTRGMEAFCASAGINKHADTGDVREIVITDIPVTENSISIVSDIDPTPAGPSGDNAQEPEAQESSSSSTSLQTENEENESQDEPSGSSNGESEEDVDGGGGEEAGQAKPPMSEKSLLSGQGGAVEGRDNTVSSLASSNTMSESAPPVDQQTQQQTEAAPAQTQEQAMDTTPGQTTEASAPAEPAQPESQPEPEQQGQTVADAVKEYMETLSEEERKEAMANPQKAVIDMARREKEEKMKLQAELESYRAQAREAEAKAAEQALVAELNKGISETQNIVQGAIKSFGLGSAATELKIGMQVALGVMQEKVQDPDLSPESKRAAIAKCQEKVKELAARKDETKGSPEDWFRLMAEKTIVTPKGFQQPPQAGIVEAVGASRGIKTTPYDELLRNASAPRRTSGISIFDAEPLPSGSLANTSKLGNDYYKQTLGYLERSAAIENDWKQTGEITSADVRLSTLSSIANIDLPVAGKQFTPPNPNKIGIMHIPKKDYSLRVVHPLAVPGVSSMFQNAMTFMGVEDHASAQTKIWNAPYEKTIPFHNYTMGEPEYSELDTFAHNV